MNISAQLRDRPMSFVPWLFPLGLGLVIAVNMGMLWFALSTFPGTVTRNAYEEGRKYDRILAVEAKQAQLGWVVDIAFAADVADTLEVRYRDREGRPIDGLVPAVVASRPVGDSTIVEATLHPSGAGLYRGALPLPRRGVWDLRVSAENGDGRYYSATRVTLR